MLWPILLWSDPRDTAWSLGERVSTRLRWLDSPGLPDDLVVHQVGARASALLDADGRPWAQLVQAGGLRAVRDGHRATGSVTLDGCLGYDAYLPLIGELPATEGTVRRVRVLHQLHDRGTDEWLPRPGALRLTDVPDAAPFRLRDDPDGGEPESEPDGEPEPDPGTIVLLSPEQYFRWAYDRLPAEQWQAQGFLVDLEVPDA